MRLLIWVALALATCAQAQSSTTLLIDNTVTPSSTSMRPTVTQVVTVSVSSTLTVTTTVTSTSTITTTIGSSPTITSTSTSTSTPASSPTSTSASTSSSISSSVTTSISTSASTSMSTTTSTSNTPVVTDQAYIDTILRNHNQHRSNHSANALTWNAALAETARKISNTCVYQHDTTTDGGGYGQNIAAGYLPNQMSSLVSDGFYNSEVNSYTYYGGEPDYNAVGSWGHFSQIVWKGTTSVGCYTNDCSATGLTFPNGGGANIPPYFTVCNYGPAGNVVGAFTNNVGAPLGFPSIHAGYNCPTTDNCVG